MNKKITDIQKYILFVGLAWLLSISGGSALVSASPAEASISGIQASDPSGMIVFASQRDGNFEIYTMNADGSNPTRLTNNSWDDWAPVWSPDGQYIAYSAQSNGNKQIYRMRADGSNQTRLSSLTTNDADPSWSPDGTRIAFHTIRNTVSRIAVMNADGSNRIMLSAGYDYHAAWSPDGKRIAFTSERNGNPEIYVMNSNGSGQTRLTVNSASDIEPNWSPDSKFILFTSDRDGNREIYRMYANGLGQTRLTSNTGIDFEPAWACSGTTIVYASEMLGTSEIYIMNTDGTGNTRITNEPTWDRHPSWQPMYCLRPVAQIASSSALPNVLLVSFKQSPTPLYSLNGGFNWQPVITTPWLASFDPNIPDNPLHVAVVPRSGSIPTRLIVAYNGTIYRTGDFGQTWAQVTLPIWWGCDIGIGQSFDLLTTPADPDRLYLDQACDDGTTFGIWKRILFTSADAGLVWQDFTSLHYKPIPSPILAEQVTARWYDLGWFWEVYDGVTWSSLSDTWVPPTELALDGQDPNRLYGIDFYEEPPIGYQSSDAGETWTAWNEQPCSDYNQLIAHPTISNTLLLRCDQGLFGSQNGGDNWTQRSTWEGVLLAPDYGNPGWVLWARIDGLWSSMDSGVNWNNLTPDYLNHNFLPFVSR